MTNKTITFSFIRQIFKSIKSSTLDRVLWKLLNSLDQGKGSKVMIQYYLSYVALIKEGHDISQGLRFCLHLKYHVVGNGGCFSSPSSI